MNVDEFRRHGHSIVDLMADYLDQLDRKPPWQPVPPDRRERLAGGPLPTAGQPFDELLDFVSDEILPHPFGNGHPRFLAWANPAPALEGALAELIAATMNPSCAGADHAATYLERGTVRWLAELVGYPGDGVLLSGGAAGAMTGLAAARHWASERRGWSDRAEGITNDRGARLRVYASAETHSCQRKAVQLLGLGDGALRLIATDERGAMDMAALGAAIREDEEDGLDPFCVVANAGTISTGVIDPLASIADLCEREQLWFHIDASLGGFGILDERKRVLFHGLDRADSLVLDPHKWLSVPIDCAAILTRDLDLLRDTFSLVPPYLRADSDELPYFSEYVFDQTRPFRALKLWATIAGVGRDELAARIVRNIDQATRLADQITTTPDLELVTEPELNVVTFRHSGGDRLNATIPAVVRRDGDIYLRGTVFGGLETLRVCFMHHGTTTADVDRVVPAVLRAADELVSG